MRFKLFIIKILSLVTTFGAYSQHSEVGIFGGASHFIGDVGHYGLHVPQGFAGGIFYQYNIDRHWAVRAQANYGSVANADEISNMDYRVNRNLSFHSPIWEGSLMMQFHFLEFEPGTKYFHTPYILGGIGAFSFDPRAEYEGEIYRLRPMGTEGQLTPASSSGFYQDAASFFIFGMGYKWAVGEYTSIGLETTFRSTATDYLDDVSGYYADPAVVEEHHGAVAAALSDRSLTDSDKDGTYRGNPQNNDWYIFTGVTLQIKFGELYEKCANFVR